MLSPEQRAAYDRDGFVVVPDVVDLDTCATLIARAGEIAASSPDERSVFTTKEQERVSDERFLASGPRITCFTEPDGVTLAKIGHALHDLDPVFAPFSRRPEIASLVEGLLEQPLLLQSMYLCKAALSGGEVDSHQDATFLWTDPVTVTGIWVALEDATVENGCLWALPGGHTAVPLEKRFVRAGATDADGTAFAPLADGPVEVPAHGWVPLEAKAGTVVLLHGLLPHRSSPNTSPRSRAAYSLHLVDGTAHYPADNWLQRPADMPALGFAGA